MTPQVLQAKQTGDETFACGGDAAPLSILRALPVGRSLQFKARFTPEAAGGVYSQVVGRFAALWDELSVFLWNWTFDL